MRCLIIHICLIAVIKGDIAFDQNNQTHKDVLKLLPTRKYCGFQHKDDRFYNETGTAIDEFPWLAHLIYTTESLSSSVLNGCSGTIITNRYVITTEICSWNIIKVRLGQHNTNQSVVCIDNPNYAECTEPPLEIDVENVISRSDSEVPHYNLALLRLASKFGYSDFVRPICLPIWNTLFLYNEKDLLISGWGANDIKGIEKKRLGFTRTHQSYCFGIFNTIEPKVQNISYICLTPTVENAGNVCSGDEGGPVMYSHRHQWYLIGTISGVYFFDNARYCSNNLFIDAVRLSRDKVEWILENLRP